MKKENAHTAQLFRFTRDQLGMNVRDMAKRLKISASNVSRIESGHINPGQKEVDGLVQLSNATDLESLFRMVYR